MNAFTLEELEDLRLIYKTFCTEVHNANRVVERQLTDLEKSIISKLETLIHANKE